MQQFMYLLDPYPICLLKSTVLPSKLKNRRNRTYIICSNSSLTNDSNQFIKVKGEHKNTYNIAFMLCKLLGEKFIHRSNMNSSSLTK